MPDNPTKENYNFLRWEDKNGTPIYDKALLEPHDITLYAVWERKTFTVTFDSKGGSYVSPITVNAGDTLTLPAPPTHEKFYFLCWEDKNGTSILDGALLEPHDITLYARWKSWTPLSIGILSPHTEVSNNGYEITIEVADGTDTVLMANQDVEWTWESNGVMTDAKVDEDYGWELDFTATYVSGQQATIKVTAEDETVMFIYVIPVP